MSTYPPDGFSTTPAGYWPDNFAYNTAITNLIGNGCVEFKDTTPIENPQLRTTKLFPVEEGQPYLVKVLLQASSIAGGNTAQVSIRWYTGAGVYISRTDIYAAAVLPSADVWHVIGGIADAVANARYGRVVISKSNTAFTLYFDYLDMARMPVAFWAYDNTGTSLNVGTTLVALDAEIYDYGSSFDAAGTNLFTAPSAGIYSFTGGISCTISATDHLGAGLNINTGAYFITGNDSYAGTITAMSVQVSAAGIYLSRGDTVGLVGLLSGAGAHAVSTGKGTTFLMGAKVE